MRVEQEASSESASRELSRAEAILHGLDPEQRSAVELTRGPVCILAGAGSGKTTTITRRIAYQVATGAFAPGEILAVTFTDKAAGEMRARLRALGVAGVRARTFHATALAQLTHFVPDVGSILPSKGVYLGPIVRALKGPFRFRPVAEYATEIEWAKNRRLTPERYTSRAVGDERPLPPWLVQKIFRAYEERKRRERRIDFEDVLELLVRFYESDPAAIERFRARCRAITVDEYQDVNLLQQTLLDLWLGERDELCAVGDDHQAIYSFTGASAGHLLGMASRFPKAAVVVLERNYRSTPEILGLANRLAPNLEGRAKTLRTTRPVGPAPVALAAPTLRAEVEAIAERIRELRSEGVQDEEIALLYRVNARSDDLEGPLARAGIPYQVRGGAFLDRPAARAVLRLLRRRGDAPAATAVREAAEEAGLVDEPGEELGDEGLTFQEDLHRFVDLAAATAEGTRVRDFLADLDARFRSDGDGRGVQLLTYHRAKGLEFEAVFLPFLQDGELPSRQAKRAESVAEERRLLYVGITRAKRWLMLSWSMERTPSPFLAELELSGRRPAGADRQRRPSESSPAVEPDWTDPALAALREWRRERALAEGVRAFRVFGNRTLVAIAEARPASLAALGDVSGVGPEKLERYGKEVIAVLSGLNRT